MAKSQISRKKYRQENKDKIAETQKIYNMKNREKRNKLQLLWYKKYGLSSVKKIKEYRRKREYLLSLSTEELLAFVRMDDKK